MKRNNLAPGSKDVFVMDTRTGSRSVVWTLLELGNCTLDLLRDLINLPAGQSIIASKPLLDAKYGRTLDVREGISTARRNLEGILVYAVTQLAMWLSKPEYDGQASNDMDTDIPNDVQPRIDLSIDRRPRNSQPLTDRLRRGMTGEMGADLQSLLKKAKPIIAKTNGFVDKDTLDLTQVLSTFLQDRIISQAQG